MTTVLARASNELARASNDVELARASNDVELALPSASSAVVLVAGLRLREL